MKGLGLGFKIMLLASLLVALTAGSLIFLSYRTAYADLENKIGTRLQAIASTGALLLSGDKHEMIKGEQDEKKPAFQELRKILRQIKKSNNLSTEVYTFRKVDDKTLKFVVMTNQKPYIGHTYQMKKEMKPAFDEGKGSRTKIFYDQHGAWISAYAPIRNAAGKVVGILDVDVKLKTFKAQLWKKTQVLLLDSLVVLILSLLLSFLMSRTLVKQLRYLRDVTKNISLGQMDQKIKVSSSDEVGQLAESLERMRESLKVAMEMIADDDDDD